MRPIHVVSLLLLALSGCASMPQPGCGAAAQPAVQDALYFGTAKPGGVVTQDEWAQFLSTDVTPRFPQGLTAWPAAGQWRASDGSIVREAAHVVLLVHPDDAATNTAVLDIVAAYKARFQQEAVLRVQARACVSF